MHTRVTTAFVALWCVSLCQHAMSLDSATLEAMWLFDETSGNVAMDSSGHDRHGDLQGGSEWADGVFGGSYSPDGAAGQIVMTGYKHRRSAGTHHGGLVPHGYPGRSASCVVGGKRRSA